MRHSKRLPLLGALLLLLFLQIHCNKSMPTEPAGAHTNPAWLDALIAQIESEPVTTPPSAIYGYRYPENAPAHYKAIYERHNHEAMQFLGERCRPLCWEDGDSWPELCSFLEEELPQVPLPFENRAWQPPVDHRIATALQCKLEQAKLARRARMGREMPKGLLA